MPRPASRSRSGPVPNDMFNLSAPALYSGGMRVAPGASTARRWLHGIACRCLGSKAKKLGAPLFCRVRRWGGGGIDDLTAAIGGGNGDVEPLFSPVVGGRVGGGDQPNQV